MILVSGSLAYDYIMDFPGYFRDHLLPEKLHVLSVSFLIKTMRRNFGGTAGNIAYNLALLGEKPTILASAGNDFGAYRTWLRAKGVELRAVNRVDGVPTAGAYIMTDKADNQITAFYPGAMQLRMENVELRIKKLKDRVKMAIVAPGNVEDMKTLPRLYKKHGVPYVYDPGQNIIALSGKELRSAIAGARVFISNDYELELVLRRTGWTKRDVLRKVEVLVTTLGEKGSVIEVGSSVQRLASRVYRILPAKPKNTSDPTGAGDAYRAGFIKGLLLGLPYDKVGKLASVVAAYTVEQYGTQTHVFTWQEVLLRYRKNYRAILV